MSPVHVAYVKHQLTPWHQNLKVYHRIRNSQPLAPILSHFNAHHTPVASLSKIYSDAICSLVFGVHFVMAL
jgi:hypothetical protein